MTYFAAVCDKPVSYTHLNDKIENNAQKTGGFLWKQAVCLYIVTKNM